MERRALISFEYHLILIFKPMFHWGNGKERSLIFCSQIPFFISLLGRYSVTIHPHEIDTLSSNCSGIG